MNRGDSGSLPGSVHSAMTRDAAAPPSAESDSWRANSRSACSLAATTRAYIRADTAWPEQPAASADRCSFPSMRSHNARCPRSTQQPSDGWVQWGCGRKQPLKRERPSRCRRGETATRRPLAGRSRRRLLRTRSRRRGALRRARVSVIQLAAALPDRDAGTKHLALDGPPGHAEQRGDLTVAVPRDLQLEDARCRGGRPASTASASRASWTGAWGAVR